MEEHCVLFRDALECAAEQRCCWLSSFSESFRVDIQGLLSSATLILWKSEKHLKITAICTNLYSTYLVPITKTIIFNLTKLEIIYTWSSISAGKWETQNTALLESYYRDITKTTLLRIICSTIRGKIEFIYPHYRFEIWDFTIRQPS